jgi:hypothetical protein
MTFQLQKPLEGNVGNKIKIKSRDPIDIFGYGHITGRQLD